MHGEAVVVFRFSAANIHGSRCESHIPYHERDFATCAVISLTFTHRGRSCRRAPSRCDVMREGGYWMENRNDCTATVIAGIRGMIEYDFLRARA